MTPVRLIIPTCGQCPFIGHSGAFTPGGAKSICHHKAAVSTFAAHIGKDAPNPDNLAGGDRYHWKHRMVDRDASPPSQCPIRNQQPNSRKEQQ